MNNFDRIADQVEAAASNLPQCRYGCGNYVSWSASRCPRCGGGNPGWRESRRKSKLGGVLLALVLIYVVTQVLFMIFVGPADKSKPAPGKAPEVVKARVERPVELDIFAHPAVLSRKDAEDLRALLTLLKYSGTAEVCLAVKKLLADRLPEMPEVTVKLYAAVIAEQVELFRYKLQNSGSAGVIIKIHRADTAADQRRVELSPEKMPFPDWIPEFQKHGADFVPGYRSYIRIYYSIHKRD